ncbi:MULTISPECIES: tetratricopeptide repeat protein [unclassified Virgibacillus]|uniref:tetratricopeptide repeat protein n=1 Tax=unclassified Virgibacillus TaxID=2620237 RepID=UPI0024DE3035|nr:tetratricopeptide repeat protein [Virgibacillus sp. LDC-1]
MKDKVEQLIRNKQYDEARNILFNNGNNLEGAEKNYYIAVTFDAQGAERKAIPYYEQVIEEGIDEERLIAAYCQLGSSYRSIGQYEEAERLLKAGLQRYPTNEALNVFYAMVLYNQNKAKQGMEILLHLVAQCSSIEWIKKYENAISFYAKQLDKTW